MCLIVSNWFKLKQIFFSLDKKNFYANVLLCLFTSKYEWNYTPGSSVQQPTVTLVNIPSSNVSNNLTYNVRQNLGPQPTHSHSHQPIMSSNTNWQYYQQNQVRVATFMHVTIFEINRFGSLALRFQENGSNSWSF